MKDKKGGRHKTNTNKRKIIIKTGGNIAEREERMEGKR